MAVDMVDHSVTVAIEPYSGWLNTQSYTSMHSCHIDPAFIRPIPNKMNNTKYLSAVTFLNLRDLQGI